VSNQFHLKLIIDGFIGSLHRNIAPPLHTLPTLIPYTLEKPQSGDRMQPTAQAMGMRWREEQAR
jgi:hypothetical protein